MKAAAARVRLAEGLVQVEVDDVEAHELVNRIGVDAVYSHDVALANRLRVGLGLEPGNSALTR